ncbi:hypothetical protein Nepgr_013741 [Nepenthes gracilis]|uniref:Uncharacterized protein n=1 Tax=Nepenthes gracilis TaxID=150966 RepID=A0AAD3SI11_NEPGR|nr:hypothetical protein Nepgr_013741 [Nepenthes gracilis]
MVQFTRLKTLAHNYLFNRDIFTNKRSLQKPGIGKTKQKNHHQQQEEVVMADQKEAAAMAKAWDHEAQFPMSKETCKNNGGATGHFLGKKVLESPVERKTLADGPKN